MSCGRVIYSVLISRVNCKYGNGIIDLQITMLCQECVGLGEGGGVMLYILHIVTNIYVGWYQSIYLISCGVYKQSNLRLNDILETIDVEVHCFHIELCHIFYGYY